MKSPTYAPREIQDIIKTTLTVPRQNYDKANYIVDLDSPARTHWIGTESGLLGAFHFDGACTDGDGSCDVVSHSMGADFCNLSVYLTDSEPTLQDINKWIQPY